MLDHVGIGVSDFARAKAFYDKALAPLGIALVMEVSAEQTGDQPACGFGSQGKPYFWFGGAPDVARKLPDTRQPDNAACMGPPLNSGVAATTVRLRMCRRSALHGP